MKETNIPYEDNFDLNKSRMTGYWYLYGRTRRRRQFGLARGSPFVMCIAIEPKSHTLQFDGWAYQVAHGTGFNVCLLWGHDPLEKIGRVFYHPYFFS